MGAHTTYAALFLRPEGLKNVAKCWCGNEVQFDGQECDQCYFDRFVTFFLPARGVKPDLARMQRLMAEYEQLTRRSAFEADHPGLYRAKL